MNRIAVIWLAFMLTVTGNALAQGQMAAMPKIVAGNGGHALIVDGKPFFILGGQVHNSSAWPGMMAGVWAAAKRMQLNTLEIPVYWEQIEGQKGKFDYSLIDTLLLHARIHRVRLVLLWFATWKNGSNHYMPAWMKADASNYPNISGLDGRAIDSPSPHSPATLGADITAFTMIMKHLKKADAQHTVIMVQVENEPGAWDSMRDYSPVAQKLFEGQVPRELLKPDVLASLGVPVVTGGTWGQVFGDRADEYFHAWSVANFIGKVAAAGKKEYPLPLYVNDALRDPLTNPKANTYESGGPTDNVIPIWKIAAPAIDLLAPDIYLTGSDRILKVLELYDRPDNPLFVPEAAFQPGNAKYIYAVLAHGGIGFSPFGIDDNGRVIPPAETNVRISPFAQEYSILAPMMRELALWAFEGKIKAVVEREDHADQAIPLEGWDAIVSFSTGSENVVHSNEQAAGKLMIVQLDKDKFLVAGTDCHITFKAVGSNHNKVWQYLKVEEGHYENGSFIPLRILNGDETDFGGPRFGLAPAVLKITLIIR